MTEKQGAMATYLFKFEFAGDIVSAERCTKRFENNVQSQKSLWIRSQIAEIMRQFSAGSMSST